MGFSSSPSAHCSGVYQGRLSAREPVPEVKNEGHHCHCNATGTGTVAYNATQSLKLLLKCLAPVLLNQLVPSWTLCKFNATVTLMELIFLFLLLHYCYSSLPSCSHESTVTESKESLSNFYCPGSGSPETDLCARYVWGVHARLTLIWGKTRKLDSVEGEVE